MLKELGFETEYGTYTNVTVRSFKSYATLMKLVGDEIPEEYVVVSDRTPNVVLGTTIKDVEAVMRTIETANEEIQKLEEDIRYYREWREEEAKKNCELQYIIDSIKETLGCNDEDEDC